jgi:hypothetical protein
LARDKTGQESTTLTSGQMEVILLNCSLILGDIVTESLYFLMGSQEPREQQSLELGNFILAATYLCQKFFIFIVIISNEISVAVVTIKFN